MAEKLPLILNGEDFTEYVRQSGYSFWYEDVCGPNNGVMADGSETYDLLKRKACVQWAMQDLPSEKLADVLQICADTYISATVFDTKLNAPRSMICRPIVGAQTMLLTDSNGTKWFTGQVLSLREK